MTSRFPRSFRIALMLLATPLLGVTVPPDDETKDDFRCLVVSVRMMESENASLRAAGLGATMYFVGRLDGHAPDADLEAGMTGTLLAMTPTMFKDEATRCGELLKDRGKVMTEAGQRMENRARQMLRGQPETQ